MKTGKLNRISGKALFILLAVAICMPLSVANAESLPTFQVAEVHTFSDNLPTTSGGTLLRKKNAVWARLAMHGLDPDAAYSVWWVVFNDPDTCARVEADTCVDSDLATAGGSILNAAGFVTGSSGSANFTAHLEARRPPAGLDLKFGKGILPGNGYGAEIHMLFLPHGPVEGLEDEVGQHISHTEGSIGPPQFGIAFLPLEEED